MPYPSLQASFQPGGTVSFEHRNIKGLNRSILGSITTSNFFSAQVISHDTHFLFLNKSQE
jgi:hypothetical protein